jgi:polar amino acid transport system permease protein
MLEGFNFRIIWEYMPFFMEGVRNTALISLISLFLALIAGIVACAG